MGKFVYQGLHCMLMGAGWTSLNAFSSGKVMQEQVNNPCR